MLLSFERLIVGAFAFVIPRATLLLLNGLVHAVLPESKNMRKRTIGVPQELGRSCRLLGKFPAGATGLPTPGLGGGARPPRSEKNECQPRYHQAKATKRGGMGGRKSQHPHSTEEAGELVPRDPVEGRKNRKGVSDAGPWAGNYVQGFVLGDTYHRHDPG